MWEGPSKVPTVSVGVAPPSVRKPESKAGYEAGILLTPLSSFSRAEFAWLCGLQEGVLLIATRLDYFALVSTEF